MTMPLDRTAKKAPDPISRLAVLISGRGSNLQAIIDAVAAGTLHAEIAVVLSNRADAAGLERARRAGIETLVLDHRDPKFGTREEYDRALAKEMKSRGVSLVCLAGFMRLLSPVFLDAYPNAILNIHPSLLPSFPGTNAQYQAWEHGVRVTGVTVHLVTAELDGGPIVMQETVPVLDSDNADSLAERILEKEHQVFPKAIAAVLERKWRVEGRRFVRV
jgi:phosphoribosylglycinamide formyltransferase-1